VSHSTQLNVETINAQAARHDEIADNITQQIAQLKSQVDATLAASTSGATRALSTSCDSWADALNKTAVSHLKEMAENIRREANNQAGTDEDATRDINNSLVEASGSFLGGVTG
jgi:gas vesicle protein